MIFYPLTGDIFTTFSVTLLFQVGIHRLKEEFTRFEFYGRTSGDHYRSTCFRISGKFFKLLNTTNVHFEAGFIVTFCKDTFAFEFLIKQGLQMFVTFLRTKNVNNVSVCEFRNIY